MSPRQQNRCVYPHNGAFSFALYAAKFCRDIRAERERNKANHPNLPMRQLLPFI